MPLLQNPFRRPTLNDQHVINQLFRILRGISLWTWALFPAGLACKHLPSPRRCQECSRIMKSRPWVSSACLCICLSSFFLLFVPSRLDENQLQALTTRNSIGSKLPCVSEPPRKLAFKCVNSWAIPQANWIRISGNGTQGCTCLTRSLGESVLAVHRPHRERHCPILEVYPSKWVLRSQREWAPWFSHVATCYNHLGTLKTSRRPGHRISVKSASLSMGPRYQRHQ